MKAGSAALKAAARRAAIDANRRGARRRAALAVNREVSTVKRSANGIVKNTGKGFKSGVIQEAVESIARPMFNDMPPIWKQYTEN